MTLGEVEEGIEQIGEVIEREYADPDVGTEVRRSLREGLSEGRFPSLYTTADVAAALTQELYVLTHDRGLSVSVVKIASGRDTSDVDRREQVRRTNGGVSGAVILPGNVGYLHVSVFWDDVDAQEAIRTAMHLLRHADALIIDVRDTSGDSVEAVTAFASYLFASPSRPLLEMTYRLAPASRYSTMSPSVPDLDETRPVYVLTSARSASSGEMLALLVQDGGRGEVIGDSTAGNASPKRVVRIGDRLDVTIPAGQVKSLFSGRKLDTTGVKPDVMVAADDALRVAHVRALRRLITANPDADWRARLAKELELAESSTSR